MFKTKLQELCQKKKWGLPKYTATKDGPDHNSRFKSSVFVNALSFHSPYPCKSSKQAQNDAARLAFLHFTSSPPPNSLTIQEAYNGQSHDFSVKVAMSRSAELHSPTLLAKECLEYAPGLLDLTTFVDMQHIIQHEKNSAENEDKIQGLKLAQAMPSNLKIVSEDPVLSDSVSKMDNAAAPSPRSYLLCERVRVYASYPNIVFPEGITVLPISDNKWVAVSLEFPNEQGY